MMYIWAWQAPEFAPARLISSRITEASVTPSPPPPYSAGISAASDPAIVICQCQARGPRRWILRGQVVGDGDGRASQQGRDIRGSHARRGELREPDAAVDERRRDAVGEAELRLVGRVGQDVAHDR